MTSQITAVDGYTSGEITNYQNDPEFIADSWAIGVTEEVLASLEQMGESQTWLATKLGVSRARVSSLLNAPPNMTFLTLAKLVVAIGEVREIVFRPNGDMELRGGEAGQAFVPGPSAHEDLMTTAALDNTKYSASPANRPIVGVITSEST